MGIKYAFIDETGNFGFNFQKKGVSTHFVATSIIVPENGIKDLSQIVQVVRDEYFNGAELKASRLKRKKKGVDEIIQRLSSGSYHVLSVICDKKEMYSKGLRYKTSFYKFLNGLLYVDLYRSFPRLRIHNDEYGSEEYMQSFVQYVSNNQNLDLFGQSDFTFVDSEDSNIIQLADVLGGIISENYDNSYPSQRIAHYLSYFEEHILKLNEWPTKFDPNFFVPKYKDDAFEESIAELSINLAHSYLGNHDERDSAGERDRINCLNYLLLHFKHIDSMEYLYGNEIMNHLNELRDEEISERYFRTKVISKLRDSDVLISSSNKGYKLPCSKNDLYEFVDQTKSMVLPMLHRLSNFRDQIKISTTDEIDILNREEFRELKDIIDTVYGSSVLKED